MRAIWKLLSVLVLATIGGCSPAPRVQTAAAPPSSSAEATAGSASHRAGARTPKGATMMDGICPMAVQGTTVTASDIDGGIALTFVTPTGDVSELRRRVRRMAEMHETGCGIMGQRGTMMAGREMSDSTSGSETASADDVEHGARLVLKPADPGQLDSFRQQVRVCVEHLKHGECPMTMPSAGSTDERGRLRQGSP